VEIIVSAEHVDRFVAKASGNDLYACIDEAAEKMERQLREHKEQVRNRKHAQR
jgi:ribosomal subunit interface protein